MSFKDNVLDVQDFKEYHNKCRPSDEALIKKVYNHMRKSAKCSDDKFVNVDRLPHTVIDFFGKKGYSVWNSNEITCISWAVK